MLTLSVDTLVLALNLAIASIICSGIAIAVSRLFRSLPKQHAMLVCGPVMSLLAPLAVALAWQFQLAQLPTVSGRVASPAIALNVNSAEPHRSDFAASPQEPIRTAAHDRNPLHARSLTNASLPVDTRSTGSSPHPLAQPSDAARRMGPLSRPTLQSAGVVASVCKLGNVLVLVWITGTTIAMLFRVRDWFCCQRLIQSCRPVELSIALEALQIAKRRTAVLQDVPLLFCAGLPAPVVVGCVHPRIVLPSSVDQLFTSRQLESMLVHELTHIARKDHWTLALLVASQTIYWWNPMVFVVGRKLSEIREMICDDAAISEAEEPRAYAEMIVGMAERAMAGTTRFVPLGMSESSESELTRRIERLLTKSKRLFEPRLSTRFRALLALFSGLLLVSAIAAQVPAPQVKSDDAEFEPFSNEQASDAKPDDETPKADDANAGVHQLTLKIVDTQGQPIPQAQVQIREKSFQDDWLVEGKTIERRGWSTTVEANDKGLLTLKLPAGVSPAFAIRAPGYADYWAEWGRNPIPDEHVVELENARTIGGLVVDDRGQPLPGATLRASTYFKMRTGDSSVLVTGNVVTSDELGKWSIANVPLSLDNVAIEVNHPEFKPYSANVSTALFDQSDSRSSAQSIVMQRGLVVRGRVTDEAGAPLDGAVVRTKFRNTLRETASRADGTYELVGCIEQLATITVSAPGKALTMQKVQIIEDMQSVDFTMQAGGHIRIRVVDHDGQPVPRTRMFFQKWKGEQIRYFEFDHINSYTDERGIWEWNEAPLEELHIDICPPDGTSHSQQPIQARAEEYVFEALPLLRIAGKVIDAETREPIEKFQVVPGVRGSPNNMNWIPSEVFDGTNGEFEYTSSHGYLAHFVKVQADGYAPIESREVASDEGTVKILFELERASGINMRVMTPDGQPAAGAKVVIGVKGSQININNGDIDDGSTYAERTVVNAAGRFKFPEQATPYQLVILHDTGFAHVDSQKLAHPDLIKLTPWAKLRGTFRSSGQPVAGLQLYLNSGSVHSYGADTASIFTTAYLTTDKDGHFSLDRVFPGDGRIARSIVRVHNQGAQEVASSKSIHASFMGGETTNLEFSGQGAEVRARLTIAAVDTDQPLLWTFVDVNLEPAQAEIRQIPFPPGVEDDPDLRSVWFQEWRTTDEGKQWRVEYEAAMDQRNKLPAYSATVAKDGTVSITDVEAGQYNLTARFWDGSRTEGIEELKLIISPQAAASNETIDLGELKLQQSR